jgi:hypothetical protein
MVRWLFSNVFKGFVRSFFFEVVIFIAIVLKLRYPPKLTGQIVRQWIIGP